MSLSDIPCRNWGLNYGEEPFIPKPLAMVATASCSAECMHCYLRSDYALIENIPADILLENILKLHHRGASCLFLVNPEVPNPESLRYLLSSLRNLHPSWPVILKLGGHEPVALLENLHGLFDAASLDVKVFSDADGLELLGIPDYTERVDKLCRHLSEKIGIAFRDLPDYPFKGLWLRHVILPGRERWLDGIASMPALANVPLWLLTCYRPFGRAFKHPRMCRRLTEAEINIAMEAAVVSQKKGRLLWFT